jgi:hypothetical protein
VANGEEPGGGERVVREVGAFQHQCVELGQVPRPRRRLEQRRQRLPRRGGRLAGSVA